MKKFVTLFTDSFRELKAVRTITTMAMLAAVAVILGFFSIEYGQFNSPAPWTPGAVVPDLQPLLAFSLEPSSGLSAAWVDTRRPPPLGVLELGGGGVWGWFSYGGRQLAEGTSQSPAATAPLKRGG